MGFFSELKEDFSQAVSELGDLGKPEENLPVEVAEETASAKEKETKNSNNKEEENVGLFDDGNVDKDLLDSLFASQEEDETQQLGDVLETAMEEADKKADDKKESKKKENKKDEKKSEKEEELKEEAKEEIKEEVKEEKKDEKQEKAEVEEVIVPQMPDPAAIEKNDIREEAEQEMDEERSNGTVTVITKGTIINGGISSDGSLEVMGSISGDVECLGKLSIIGKVTGNAIAAEIFVNSTRMEGNLSSEGAIKVGVGTVIFGDVVGSSAVIAGAVKGDIDVNGPVVVDSTAIVQGNIKAKSIQVNNGAVVDGYCSLNYAGVDLATFFNDAE